MAKKNNPQVIALLLNLSKEIERRIIRGVATYAASNPTWVIEMSEVSPPRLPDLEGWPIAGAICHTSYPQYVDALTELGVPMVLIGDRREPYKVIDGYPRLEDHHDAIGRMGADHLIAQGYRKFGYLAIQPGVGNEWSMQRLIGFRQRLREEGYEPDVIEVPPVSFGHEEVLSGALQAWLADRTEPFGVMACCDQFARYGLQACHYAKRQVPQEVGFVGVDNDELLCEMSPPPISSIETGCREMGRRAAALLDRMIAGESADTGVLTVSPTRLVGRASTALIATGDKDVDDALRYIQAHACEGISTEKVADHVGVSLSSLQRRVRTTTERTLHQHIRQTQLDRAKQLVITTDLPLKEIARRTGFRYVQYMTNVFSQTLGVTPGIYRDSGRTETS